MPERTIVAIPVRNESERIGLCLRSLDMQLVRPDAVVLLLNNCTDTTEATVRAMVPDLRFRLQVILRQLPPDRANAGHARRLAMEVAGAEAADDGILLTTDADSTAPREWIMRNLRALQGVDAVCGRAVIDPVEAAAIPAHLHADDARECHLIACLDRMAWTLDPEPHDPIPRHTEASGASLAVCVTAYRQVGGIPDICSGEDRAFVRAMWMMDAKVRHDPTIEVMVSGRVMGRAEGGMAEAIRRRMMQQDEFTDEQVEPAVDALRRYGLRYRARCAWLGLDDPDLASDLGLSQARLHQRLNQRYFGATWAALEADSSILRRRKVRFVDVEVEIARAEAILKRLSVPDTLAAD